ncbi:DUF998 domain-containing protein [Aquibium sp. A9E412]|uniref:DUF998 domain-containing protein n=1 Tax=Aquibium sp. A9E412 TaxID=2976767 RepID=UPI0025B22230|nr:DUF998 domain-containing protein [Aquibium sp. A9E412]MDN2566849.1 DUF998 domain-containing protein [Aquibium sp. A9E412]
MHRERPELLLVLAALALLGCAALIGGTLIAQALVPRYDWVSDTISDLAAGRSKIYMDIALYGYAAGLFAVALAAAHLQLGGMRWSFGTLAIAVLAGLVIVVAARDDYGDNASGGPVIHIYLVYALGALFLLAPLAMAHGLRRDHPRARRVLLVLAALWAVAAPFFFVMPTGIDGLYERLLGLVAGAMTATFGIVFAHRGWQARTVQPVQR